MRHARGLTPLFSGLSFSLAAGDALWLQGANGSGKSSLLRLLAGIALPLSGAVQANASRLYIGHRSGLRAGLTALENLLDAAQIAGQPVTELDARTALAALGLARAAGQRVETLSEGQQRRAALARLWLPKPPPLWLLDEPLAALDAEREALLGARLRRHLNEGGSLVFSSHGPLPLGDLPLRALHLGGEPRWTLH